MNERQQVKGALTRFPLRVGLLVFLDSQSTREADASIARVPDDSDATQAAGPRRPGRDRLDISRSSCSVTNWVSFGDRPSGPAFDVPTGHFWLQRLDDCHGLAGSVSS